MTKLTGAEVIIKVFKDHSVDHIFGYPGGAVLPLYDEIFKSNVSPQHILVRHEQGAAHAAEGYARSTGKPGVLIVTSGPGATNAVTGLTDAMMDSIPLVCISGQVPTHLVLLMPFKKRILLALQDLVPNTIGWLKIRMIYVVYYMKLFMLLQLGRPGPVVVDIPKDIQFADANYFPPNEVKLENYNPQIKPNAKFIDDAIDLMAKAKRPILYWYWSN